MNSPDKELLKELLSQEQATCISLYMPAHQSHPENRQDPILYKNLVKQLEISLLQQYSRSEAEGYLKPFETLSNDTGFWKYTPPGIAVFSAAGLFKVVVLPETVEELVVVAESFHTKPLRQYLQTVDRYQILGLSLDRIQLFEGNRHTLAEIALPDEMPKTLAAVLGKDVTEKHSTVASYGGVGPGSADMHHGDGGRKDLIDNDTEKYFRFIANQIFENYSKPSGLPLILAALPEHHSLFREVNKNSFLLPEGITKNPEYIATDELAKMAWELMEPVYLLKLKNLAEQFEQAKANGKGSDNLKEAAEGVATGRIATLLIESGRIIPGNITDSQPGAIKTGAIENPETDDLLDDIAELATKRGTDVLVIPKEAMPSQTGLAAIFRY